MWEKPFFTRTQFDVLEANDLNRIDGNCEYLANEFNIIIPTKKWTKYDFPQTKEFDRICENLKKLKTAYFIPPNSPTEPKTPYLIFNKINDIEYILYLLYNFYNENKKSVNYCGEIYANDGGLI